ncbi:MAG: basic amino acid ABC transporter substrate-binding protein [Thermoplasmatota archaeon]
MRKEIKAILMGLIIVMVSIAVVLSGCTEEKKNKIIVGTDATFPPFEFVDENGAITGFDIEMTKKILTDLGYEVEIKDMGFDQLIGALQTGIIDVIAAGMTITEERLQQISFSLPYYTSDQSVLVKSDSTITISSYSDFANLKLGAQTGTTGALWVEEHLMNTTWLSEQNINYSLNVTLESYGSYTDAVLDLGIGRIDAVIVDKPVGLSFEKEGATKVIYTIITNESFGLGVKKENTELLQKINQKLEDFMASEEWDILVKKYFE